MMDLIDSDLTKESGAPTEFVVINEKTFLDLDNNKLILLVDGSYYINQYKVKVNPSLNDNFISFSNKYEVRILLISGYDG